jgi:Ser/Thr protein kinase RdoA (MazF antagonist)
MVLSVRSLPIPGDLAAVDAAWLSAALDANVVAVSPGNSTGGIAVTSRVARLQLTSDPDRSAPRAVVVKIANPKWTHGCELHEREVMFYRDFAVQHDMPAPRCYYADYDAATGAFVLVLEDVGDVVPGHRLDGLTVDEAEAFGDAMADLHRTWWGRDELGRLKVRGHDADRIARTVATFDDRWHALEACGNYAIDDDLRAALPAVREHYAAGMHAISSRPQTLIHSDLHVENFFLERTPAGLRMIAIDWQNACHGHCAFDACYVLTSLQPRFASYRESLLARYHARLRQPDYSIEEFHTDIAAAVRHQFIGSANWFATFEAESLRDASTIHGHWTRLCAAVVANERC